MDKRRQNNLTAEQRRVIHRNFKRKLSKKKPRKNELEHAKTVLRRHGHEVYDAGLVDKRFKGFIYLDTRKRTPVEVIEIAREIEAKEAARNKTLRKERGLA